MGSVRHPPCVPAARVRSCKPLPDQYDSSLVRKAPSVQRYGRRTVRRGPGLLWNVGCGADASRRSTSWRSGLLWLSSIRQAFSHSLSSTMREQTSSMATPLAGACPQYLH